MKLLLPMMAAVVVVGCTPTAPDSTTDVTQTEIPTPTTDPSGATQSSPATPPPNQTQSTYLDYSPENLAAATANGGTAVIFFYADWCPTCRSADQDITQNIDQLPAGVAILKADYDTESELKNQYNVVTQHTFVQVDQEGNEVGKWSGGGMEQLVSNLGS